MMSRITGLPQLRPRLLESDHRQTDKPARHLWGDRLGSLGYAPNRLVVLGEKPD